MDIDAIYAALQQAGQQAGQESAWTPIGSFADQFSNILGQAALAQARDGGMDGSDYMGLALGGLSSGLLSGYAGNQVRDYQAEQTDMARQVLLDAAKGKSIFKPEGMSDSIFASTKGAGSMFSLAKDIEDADETRKRIKDFAQTVALQGVADKSDQRKAIFSALASAKTDYQRQQVIDAAQQMGLMKSSAESQPMVQQEQLGTNSDGSPIMSEGSARPLVQQRQAPPSQGISQYLNQTGGDEALARTLYERDLTKPDRMFDDAEKVRKEFNALPEVQDFKTVSTGYRALIEAMKDPAGTSDFEIIRRAAQAVEPGLAVRKDDQDSIEAAPSLFGSYSAQVRGALQGKSRLSDDVRAGLMRIAERSYNTNAQAFNKTRAFYRTQLSNRGLDPQILSPLEEAPPVGIPQDQPLPESVPTLGMGTPPAKLPGESKEQYRARLRSMGL